MEQWQIDVINRCAKDGNLPKGFPFNKGQIISLLGLNPAEFILIGKEKFISLTAPDLDSYTTTDRWDNLKKAGSYENLFAAEEKERLANAPKTAPVVAVVTPVVAEAKKENVAAAQQSPDPKPETKNEVKKAPVTESSTHTKSQPVDNSANEGLDLITIISIIGIIIGAMIIVLSVLKK